MHDMYEVNIAFLYLDKMAVKNLQLNYKSSLFVYSNKVQSPHMGLHFARI